MNIIHLDDNDIRNKQAKSLAILVGIHKFCVENNIRYFLIGGTLIGAVRHKGFIPWDDDIDIAMPRPDYQRFLALANNLPHPFEAHHLGSHADYIYPYAKAYDVSTTAVEFLVKPFARGVWVDIFPLDGTFDSPLVRKIHFHMIHRLSRLMMYREKAYVKTGGIFNRTFQNFHYYASLIFSRKILIAAIDKLARIKTFDESVYVGNLFGRWRYKEVVRRDVFMQASVYEFSEFKFYGPSNHHEWLSTVYGDYMRLPPVDKQKPDHSLVKLCLNESYKTLQR